MHDAGAFVRAGVEPDRRRRAGRRGARARSSTRRLIPPQRRRQRREPAEHVGPRQANLERGEAAERRPADPGGRRVRARQVARVNPRLQLVDEEATVGGEPAADARGADRGSGVYSSRRSTPGVVDADQDHGRDLTAADERLRGLVEAPVLPRHEGAARIEEVLPVLQVQHGVARRGRIVAGRQVDRHAARRAERRERNSCSRSNRPVSWAPGSASPRTIDAGPTSAVISRGSILPGHARHRTRSASARLLAPRSARHDPHARQLRRPARW